MSEHTESRLDARSALLPTLVWMVVANLLMQVVIALRGSEIDLVANLALAVVAVVYAVLIYAPTRRSWCVRIRFGSFVSHVIGFVTVNLGFHLHAAALFIADSPAIRGDDPAFPIDDAWFGVLFGMTCIWGLGLMVHLAASVMQRGYEELAA